jgi:predicted PurR-regulated permease PerM
MPIKFEVAERTVTYWLKVVALVALGWFILTKLAEYLSQIGYAATVAIGGMLVAYLFYPLVWRLNQRLPRWAAILIVYAGFGGLAVLALSYVVPIVAAQLQDFIGNLPAIENNVTATLNGPHTPLLSRLPPDVHAYISRLPAQAAGFIRNDAASYLGNLLTVLLSVFMLGAIFILIPMVSIYMLNEAEPLKRLFLGMLPAQHRERTNGVLAQLDRVAGGFVRGQVVVALIVGLLVTGLLLVLHVPYALLIGVFAGVVEIVPYLGAVAGAVPGIFMAAVAGGPLGALLAAIGFVAIHQLEGMVLSPFICGKTVRISPLAAIFAVLVGGELFGIVGILIAVPAAGAIRVLIENVRPPDEMTNAEVHPGLTRAPHDAVHPLSTTSDVTTQQVEAAIAEMKA